MRLAKAHMTDRVDGETLWHGVANGVITHMITRSDEVMYVRPLLTDDYTGVELVDASGEVYAREFAHRSLVSAVTPPWCPICGQSFAEVTA